MIILFRLSITKEGVIAGLYHSIHRIIEFHVKKSKDK